MRLREVGAEVFAIDRFLAEWASAVQLALPDQFPFPGLVQAASAMAHMPQQRVAMDHDIADRAMLVTRRNETVFLFDLFR